MAQALTQCLPAPVFRLPTGQGYDPPRPPLPIAHLHGAMRLYVNYFQPSFKLMGKTRNGAAVIKRCSPPATPCDRVIHHEAVNAETKG